MSEEANKEEIVKPDEEVKEEEDNVEDAEAPIPARRTVTGPLPLDWTRVQRPADVNGENGDEERAAPPVRFPWQVVDYDLKEDDEVCIVGTAGQKITHMGVDLGDHCQPNLKELVLRSHQIVTMEGIHTFENLELLELYDNMIDGLQALNEGANGAPGSTLRVLDMSYNGIRDMQPVSLCPNLKDLYLANNKLKTISGLGSLTNLMKIDLGANKIRVIEGLDGLVNLEELWLGKNKIENITGLEKLTKLRRLDVQSNRLTSVTGLSAQVDMLEELYLAHNGITDEGASHPTGLGLHFKQLTTLDLGRNFLTTTQPFEHLVTLEELWISGNKIETFDSIAPIGNLASLDTVYLEYNPVADDFEYRKKLKELIPSLTQIDANLIGGLTMNGIPTATSGGGAAETQMEQMRRLQEIVVLKAQAETAAKAKKQQE
jgi:protein phosphatase 1 regulatory subunit 7